MYRVIREDDPYIEEFVNRVKDYLVEAVEKKSHLTVDLSKVYSNIRRALLHPSWDGTVLKVGHCYVYCTITDSWYSDDKYLHEELLVADWSGDFREVLEGLQEFAADQGCKAVVIGTLAQEREEVYGRLLSRYGYKRVALSYMKEVAWAH